MMDHHGVGSQTRPENSTLVTMNSFDTIHAEMQAAIKRRSLKPLLRSIEVSLITSDRAAKSIGNTIFSCDSSVRLTLRFSFGYLRR